MKNFIIVVVLCSLFGCTYVHIDAGQVTVGDVSVNKEQDIKPATDVSVIP